MSSIGLITFFVDSQKYDQVHNAIWTASIFTTKANDAPFDQASID